MMAIQIKLKEFQCMPQNKTQTYILIRLHNGCEAFRAYKHCNSIWTNHIRVPSSWHSCVHTNTVMLFVIRAFVCETSYWINYDVLNVFETFNAASVLNLLPTTILSGNSSSSSFETVVETNVSCSCRCSISH